MLEIKSVSAGYGSDDVLHHVDATVVPGKISALVGPNGAGKTTLLQVVAGLHRARHGQVLIDEVDLRGRSCAQRVRSPGVVLVPEGRQVFPGISIQDNLLLGAYAAKVRGRESDEQFERVWELFPMLAERRDLPAGLLSGGQQQMLAIGRGLMANPRYLLLDEPSLGLAPLIVKTIFDCVAQLAAMDLGILVVEQNATMALSIADMGYVLDNGRVVDAGTDLLHDSEIVNQYLGIGAGAQRNDSEAMTAALREVLGGEAQGPIGAQKQH